MILSADTVEEPQNQHPDIGCCIIEQYQTRKLEYGFPKRFQILSDSIKSSWIVERKRHTRQDSHSALPGALHCYHSCTVLW